MHQVYSNVVDKTSFYVDGLEVTPIEVLHGKLPITCYRFADFAYLTDVKRFLMKKN